MKSQMPKFPVWMQIKELTIKRAVLRKPKGLNLIHFVKDFAKDNGRPFTSLLPTLLWLVTHAPYIWHDSPAEHVMSNYRNSG